MPKANLTGSPTGKILLPIILRLVTAMLPLSVLIASTPLLSADSPTAPEQLPTDQSTYQAKLIDLALYDDEGLNFDRLNEVTEPLLAEPARKFVRLSLQQCILLALAHNLDIRVDSYSPRIQMAELIRAEAAFDPTLFGTAQFDIDDSTNEDTTYFNRTVYTSGGTQTVRVPTLPFTQTHDYNYSVGLRKRLATGAVVELAQLLRRYRYLNDDDDELYYNPYNEFAQQLQITQPLLRDFGIDINRASISASRNNYRISQQQFHLTVIDTLAEVESNYWRLILLRQHKIIFEALLTEARTTLQRLSARKRLDTSTELIAQTRALMQQADAGVISARNSILDQQNRLLESLNVPHLSLAGQWEIIPSDRPTLQPCTIDESFAQQTALQLRPELIAQRLRTDTAGIAVGVAKNQVLPRLDLFGQATSSGAGQAEHTAWDNQWHNDTISYTVGLSFEVPIGNRAALASLRRRRTEQQQQDARSAAIRDQILADVSLSLDALRHAHQEIDSRAKTVLARVHSLEAYNAQTTAEVGTSPGFLDRTLRAQERLADALRGLAQVIHRYNIALMDSQRAQGTLLRHNNVKLAEDTEHNTP